MASPEVRSGVPKSMESGAKEASEGRSPQRAILEPAPSVGQLRDLWAQINVNRLWRRSPKWSQMVPKDPSWPRDSGSQSDPTEGLARRLGTRGSRILGILGDGQGTLGWSGDVWDPGGSWDLGDPGTWETLRSGGFWDEGGRRGPRSIYTTPDPPPRAAVMLMLSL